MSVQRALGTSSIPWLPCGQGSQSFCLTEDTAWYSFSLFSYSNDSHTFVFGSVWREFNCCVAEWLLPEYLDFRLHAESLKTRNEFRMAWRSSMKERMKVWCQPYAQTRKRWWGWWEIGPMLSLMRGLADCQMIKDSALICNVSCNEL